MAELECNLKNQGFSPGSCAVESGAKRIPACQATLKTVDGEPQRLITTVHLSRPENYLSIYQSGCNFSCRKCHSWSFSKNADGTWATPAQILEKAREYEKNVTLVEPRQKATAWHAHDTCRCCGQCVLHGCRSPRCPGKLEPDAILLSPQGFGPARNIVAFTGGDVMCCPEFHGQCARLIRRHTNLWVLLETNGYGLTPLNLDYLRDCGVDAFWLDIKAFDAQRHKWLTGCDNERILELPADILARGFGLEVLSLFIPGVVEENDLEKIARLLEAVDPAIPFTLLAFFPEYRMKDYSAPTVHQILNAYQRVKTAGLRKVRIGNLGVFLHSQEDQAVFTANVDPGDY